MATWPSPPERPLTTLDGYADHRSVATRIWGIISVVTAERKPPRSAGTRTMSDVLKALFRRPTAGQVQGDAAALQLGEGRRVTCFLRASFGPYPRRVRHGVLDLTASSAKWRPFWSLRRRPLNLELHVESISVRPPGPAEWNVKKGGNVGFVRIPQFLTIVCKTTEGTAELTVANIDVPLVTGFFRPRPVGTD